MWGFSSTKPDAISRNTDFHGQVGTEVVAAPTWAPHARLTVLPHTSRGPCGSMAEENPYVLKRYNPFVRWTSSESNPEIVQGVPGLTWMVATASVTGV